MKHALYKESHVTDAVRVLMTRWKEKGPSEPVHATITTPSGLGVVHIGVDPHLPNGDDSGLTYTTRTYLPLSEVITLGIPSSEIQTTFLKALMEVFGYAEEGGGATDHRLGVARLGVLGTFGIGVSVFVESTEYFVFVGEYALSHEFKKKLKAKG